MNYIYGPVKSRRLGVSLGISLTPHKVCNFDCVYCQLGRTTKKTNERKEYIPVGEVIAELKRWFQDNRQQAQRLQYITFSGTGEPTLHLRIGVLISEIKKITTIPIAVLTNAALISDAAVRQELQGADVIIPSLDAVTPELFEKIDRPCTDVSLDAIIEGLIALRREFPGQIWLEVMLVKGLNDSPEHIRKLKEVIERIRPDKIQLNSPVRVPAEPDVVPLDKEALAKSKEILGPACEIV